LNQRTSGLTPPVIESDFAAVLHRVSLDGRYNHPKGFFAQVGAIWTQQSNQEALSNLSGDDFWQLNAFIGYRFLQRRVEAAVGVVNITDEDYRLTPLTLYNELPRERSFYASLKFYFK
jgi:outer membrane receptor protein involved in Fe transport